MKKVNKSNYEVFEYMSGYFGICDKNSFRCVFGGDSANEDDYNKEYISSIYDAWDGVLTYSNCGYKIEPL